MLDRVHRMRHVAAATLMLAFSSAAAQPAPYTPQTFSDLERGGWQINLLGMGGSAPQPEVPSNGGPGGAGDAYLRLTSTGQQGPGGRLMAINIGSPWTGNYLAAGITGIRVDAINLGTTDLSLRMAFESLGMFGPDNVALSGMGITLLSGGGWQSIFFPLSGLVAGLGTVDGALANVGAVRIFGTSLDAEGPPFPPAPVAATLGLDNLVATTVPEPSTVVLLGAGLLGLGAAVRRRRA